MVEWFRGLGSDPAVVPLIVACVAATASLFVAVIALISVTVTARTTATVASRTVYINSVTAERSKWIDALRRSIADYSGVAERIIARQKDSAYVDSVERATDVQSLRTHLSNLKMRLNPREEVARNLIAAAHKLDQAARLHRWVDVDLANEVMVRHGQWILKLEWHRVKLEAASGAERRALKRAETELNEDYAAFVQRDGSLHRLDAIGRGKLESEIMLLRMQLDAKAPGDASNS